jgi:hypothetical protein
MSGFPIPESRQGNRHSLFVSRTFAGRQLATISVGQLQLIAPVSGTNIVGAVQVSIELFASLEGCQRIVLLAPFQLSRPIVGLG